MSAIELGTSETLTETLAKFRQDIELYSAACLVIRDKDAKLHHMEMWGAQKIVHEKISEQLRRQGKIRAVILKARQEGVSTYTAARFFRRLHLWPGQVGMVLADTLIRASALFGMYERYHRNLPDEIKPKVRSSNSQSFLAFDHDSEISVRPASDTLAGRAQTIHLLHASEMAFWDAKSRDTWVSLTQSVPPDSGEIIVESTANGLGGLFYELWEKASDPEEEDWIAIFLPWWIHPQYEVDPPEELVERILAEPDDFERQAMNEGIPWEGENHKVNMRKLCWRRMVISQNFGGNLYKPNKDSIRAFQQEYPATAEEAFLVSGSCFFDEEKLREMARSTLIKEPESRGRLILADNVVTVQSNPRGLVRLYAPPVPEGHYVIGVDTAEGKLVTEKRVADRGESKWGGERDASVAVVLRLGYEDKYGTRFPPEVVAMIYGNPLPPEVLAEQLRLLGQMYSCGGPADGTNMRKALIAVERNHGSGQTVLRLLREHYHYHPLFYQRGYNRRQERLGQQLGWITSQESRQMMLDELSEAIRTEGIVVPISELVTEMTTFVWTDLGPPAAAEGCHDDIVMACAIAFQMQKRHHHASMAPLPQYEIQDEHTG